MLRVSRINSILLILIILINSYIIVAPFVPSAWYWWQTKHTNTIGQLTTQIHQNIPIPKTALTKPSPNSVVIPSMLLNQPILEGADTYAILNKGIWRWPSGSTPDKGSNTILIGHRFTYTNPRGVFYFLNKVKIGDEIGITWNSKKYVYKVSTISVVSPNQTSILHMTTQPTLTLYTCTPLWNPVKRLVVVAHLETQS